MQTISVSELQTNLGLYPEDFWDTDAPEIPLEKIVGAIRAERDED